MLCEDSVTNAGGACSVGKSDVGDLIARQSFQIARNPRPLPAVVGIRMDLQAEYRPEEPVSSL
jgi:thiamine pyrophosphate-dependent acetolactate synthase large subunit-like protein